MEGDMEKILSLIVPSYNMEKLLPRCLGSLELAPALMERLEVLVVNDGSKDRTSEIAHGFVTKWPGTFRVIDKTNGHYGSCINAALKVATGTYVKILDADDSFDTEGFCSYLRQLKEYAGNGVGLILTNFIWVDEQGTPYDLTRFKYETGRVYPIDAINVNDMKFMHAVTYRTENLRRMGYRQTEGICYTDNEWVFMPMTTVRQFAFVDEPVYRYLYGRAGQSMDEAVRVKNLSMFAKIALRMAEEYQRAAESCASVVKNHLLAMFSTIASTAYRIGLITGYSAPNEELLRRFDRELLHANEFLYEYVDGQNASRLAGYRFISDWRCHAGGRSLRLRLFRMLVHARTWWRSR